MDKGWQINYYISSSGDNPVKNFLNEYPTSKSKAFRIFQYIKEYGLTVAIPHIKKLTGSPLWEIRILGSDSVRILYITRKEKNILLLHAFAKKTNKTPSKEIAVALSRISAIDK